MKNQTCGDQSELVFLICDLFLLNVSSGEEKSHHPLEELVHQLDSERHHIHLMMGTIYIHKSQEKNISVTEVAYQVFVFFTSKCSLTEIPPTGGRTLLKIRKANWRPD